MKEWVYHGTTPERARLIRREGFKIGPIMLPGYDDLYYAGVGNLGYGTYVSTDWRIALWYGRVLIRASLAPGTRLLDMPPEPDPRVLRALLNKHGRGILEAYRRDRRPPPHTLMTLEEHVALLAHHYWWVQHCAWGIDRVITRRQKTVRWRHIQAMHVLGALLRRYGLHGYGESRGYNGLVVFEPSRLRADRVVRIDKQLWGKLHDDGLLDHPESLASWRDVGVDPARLA